MRNLPRCASVARGCSGVQWRGGLDVFSIAGVRRRSGAVFSSERARSVCKGEENERARESCEVRGRKGTPGGLVIGSAGACGQ